MLIRIALDEGVGCEACHGAGSEYAVEAVMRDEPAALQAGLKPVTRETCLPCHEQAHGKPFNYDEAVKMIAHPLKHEDAGLGGALQEPAAIGPASAAARSST